MFTLTDDVRNFLVKEIKEAVKQTFEYKIIETPDLDENMLNDFSKNGWELINVVNVENKFKLVFKSPK